jgi:hypothetical protein
MTTQVKFRKTLLSAALLLAGVTVQAADSLTEMFTEGEGHINFRHRFEFVDQDGFSKDATASTLRSRVNFKTAEFNKWSAFIEFEDVRPIGINNFNSGAGTSAPDRNIYPVVADPKGSDVNQAFVQYQAGDSRLRFGRQRINLDNQRFVGGVGWRQNEQTYDAASIHNKSFENTEIFYSYVNQVNRIFGNDVPAGKHDNNTHLFNVAHNFEGAGKLTGYYYSIDDDDAAAFSTSTLGVRFAGKAKPGGWNFSYTLEAARQEDNADNPVNYDAGYLRADGALALESVTLSAGFESLEGDATNPGSAFRTPLATLHAFNGWTDKFLGTPGAGLDDLFVGASGKLGRWGWKAIYHDFQAEDGNADYGTELDLSLGTKFGKHYGLLLKFADFSTDSPAFTDTTKGWVMFSANF